MGLSAFQIIWITCASILVVGWLVVSFTAPSNRRTVIEWVSAPTLYVGLLTFFLSIALNAYASGTLFVLIAIGLLCVLFGGGLVVSLWHTLTALGDRKQGESSATN